MKEQKNKRELKMMSTVSVLLGLAVVATTVAYFIYRIFSEKAYNEKWKDYNDCGL